ncbi:MAG: UDP-N-acetylmuramoyl-L-alanine--D-glutamate ligase [Clostridia bacterium]|nr:UDP-N-acetylmuramoyl-L-alanine--D-glutamate ligase [Clostridia bacterium]
MNLSGKNVVVYGAGISGLSACDLVREKGGRAIIYDDNPGAPHATSVVGVFETADIIVLSPGVQANRIIYDARLEGKTVIGELELASSLCAAEQIAITGTNGKTTTTMLVDHILKTAHINSQAVGNIGAPFSAVADKLDAMETVVIEASSFQLESACTFSPDIAVLLNIEPDHLQRHGTMQNYIRAKANIFLKQAQCDYVIYNADDQNIKTLVPDMVAKKVPFSINSPIKGGAYISSGFICFDGKPIMEVEDTCFKGRELENVLAAVSVCCIKGISPYTISAAVCSFEKPKYRRSEKTYKDILVINDSKATNVSSTVSALESLESDAVLIVGGQEQGEDFSTLISHIPNRVKKVISIGENGQRFFDVAKKSGIDVNVAADIENGIEQAVDFVENSDVKTILFSPASKSFDCFSGYEERGRYFDKIVKEKIYKL